MALLVVQIFKLDKNFMINNWQLSDVSSKSANLPFYQSLLNIFPSGWIEECGAVEDKVVSDDYYEHENMKLWSMMTRLYTAMATGMARFMAVVSWL